MVDSRDKGSRAETIIRDALRVATGLQWERVPGSGALHEKHLLKGDLYVPGKDNVYAVECKHYAEDHLTSEVLSSKSPILLDWWEQTVRQSIQVDKQPLLIFKYDRSKLFVAFNSIPSATYPCICVERNKHMFYTALLSDWLTHEKPIFIK